MSAPDVLVVGGGAVGCAVAYVLAQEGLGVRLLESERCAAGASGAAAGMLAPVGELGHGAADPRAGAALFEWGRRSLDLYPELCERLTAASGIDPEYEPSGLLRLTRSAADAERARALAARHADLGLEWLDARALGVSEPAVADDLAGALWSPREAHVRSALLTAAYAGAARRHGAEIEEGVRVDGLALEGDRATGVRVAGEVRSADHVVICTGASVASLGEWLGGGFTPPVEPVRGQIAAVEAPETPFRSILWEGSTYLVPKRDGSVVIGATEERVGFDRRVTVDGVGGLLETAPSLVPGLANSTFLGGWAGLRPGSPDGLPAIGAVPGHRSLWIAAGHHRNGVLLSAVTGRMIGDAILGKRPDPAASAFDPARWLGD